MLIMRVGFWYFWFGFFVCFGVEFFWEVCVFWGRFQVGGGSVVVLVWFFDCCWSEGTGTAECLTLNGYHSAPLSRTVLLLFGIHSCTFCLAIFGTSGCCSDWPGLCISWARCWDSLWELFLTVVLCHGRNWDEPIFGSIWMQSVRCPWKWVLKPSWKGSDAKEIGDAVSLLAAKSNTGFPLTSHTSQYICSFTRPWPINNWNTSADLLSSATCYSSKPRISK